MLPALLQRTVMGTGAAIAQEEATQGGSVSHKLTIVSFSWLSKERCGVRGRVESQAAAFAINNQRAVHEGWLQRSQALWKILGGGRLVFTCCCAPACFVSPKARSP